MYGPPLLGKHCLLYKLFANQAEQWVEWLEDDEVRQFIQLDMPPTLHDEIAWLDSTENNPNTIHWGIYVPVPANNDQPRDCRFIQYQSKWYQLIGNCAVAGINWRHQRAETGTVIADKTFWGQGIASEIMIMRRNWAFRNLPLHKLTSGYLAPNIASGKMQEKAGYRIVGKQKDQFFRNGQWIDHILTEITRSEWEQIISR